MFNTICIIWYLLKHLKYYVITIQTIIKNKIFYLSLIFFFLLKLFIVCLKVELPRTTEQYKYDDIMQFIESIKSNG